MGIQGKNIQNIMEELTDLPYYHGQIDSSKATETLKLCRPGSFLLRKSKNPRHSGTFTISVLRSKNVLRSEVYHFTVMGTEGRYYAKQGCTFNRIVDLLTYYKNNDYENHLDIPGIRLIHTINRPDYISPYHYAHVPERSPADWGASDPEFCECGMALKDTSLPEGWTIHQAPLTVPGEIRKVFFQNSQLQLTQWKIPEGLWDKVTPNQRRIIHEQSVRLQ